MSRTYCPSCKAKLVITANVRVQDWTKNNYGKPTTKRKFNHKKAAKLFAEGWTLAALAQHFGVTAPSMREAMKRLQTKDPK